MPQREDSVDWPGRHVDVVARRVAEVKNFQRTPRTTGLAYLWRYGVYGGPSPHVIWNRHISQKIFETRPELRGETATAVIAVRGTDQAGRHRASDRSARAAF